MNVFSWFVIVAAAASIKYVAERLLSWLLPRGFNHSLGVAIARLVLRLARSGGRAEEYAEDAITVLRHAKSVAQRGDTSPVRPLRLSMGLLVVATRERLAQADAICSEELYWFWYWIPWSLLRKGHCRPLVSATLAQRVAWGLGTIVGIYESVSRTSFPWSVAIVVVAASTSWLVWCIGWHPSLNPLFGKRYLRKRLWRYKWYRDWMHHVWRWQYFRRTRRAGSHHKPTAASLLFRESRRERDSFVDG